MGRDGDRRESFDTSDPTDSKIDRTAERTTYRNGLTFRAFFRKSFWDYLLWNLILRTDRSFEKQFRWSRVVNDGDIISARANFQSDPSQRIDRVPSA